MLAQCCSKAAHWLWGLTLANIYIYIYIYTVCVEYATMQCFLYAYVYMILYVCFFWYDNIPSSNKVMKVPSSIPKGWWCSMVIFRACWPLACWAAWGELEHLVPCNQRQWRWSLEIKDKDRMATGIECSNQGSCVWGSKPGENTTKLRSAQEGLAWKKRVILSWGRPDVQSVSENIRSCMCSMPW